MLKSRLNYTRHVVDGKLSCSGGEKDATKCSHDNWRPRNWSDINVVTRLFCYSERINDIRLSGEHVPHVGRFEVRIGEKWGSVCFGSNNEICTLLGYEDESTPCPRTGYSNERLEVWISHLDCVWFNSDRNINDHCDSRLYDAFNANGCDWEKTVCCQPTRLVDGVSKNSGRIEAVLYGQIYTICADEFGNTEAKVACTSIGYSEMVDFYAEPAPAPTYGAGKILNSSVECNGTEISLEHCNISISTNFTCHSGNVTGVTCSSSSLGSWCQYEDDCTVRVAHSTCKRFKCRCKYGYNGDGNCSDVLITDGRTPNSGRLQAVIRGQLESFCVTGIDMKVANTACNILGYNGAKTFSSGGRKGESVYNGTLKCNGSESSLDSCRHVVDTSINCNESEVAYIVCQGGPTKIIPFDEKPYEGVFVYYYMNEWRHIGTAIKDITAKTLCNILGFGSVGHSVVIYGEVDGGTGIVENMTCSGNESDVAECNSKLYNPYECSEKHENCPPKFGAVALYCADYKINGIRLIDSQSSNKGTVQVLVNGAWSYVCENMFPENDDIWDYLETRFACRTLGFFYVMGYQKVRAQNVTGLVGQVECGTNHSNLNDCTYTNKRFYNHSESCNSLVSINCSSDCAPGFYGDQCLTCGCNTTNILPNEDWYCDTSSGKCICDDGWTGNTCNTDIDECETTCQNNSKCVNIPGSYMCECDPGFMEVEDDKCEECSAERYGRNCSSTCSCNTDNTQASFDGRKCDIITGQCPCNKAWSGITCDDDVNECLNSSICQGQNTQCKNTAGRYECICLPGYGRQNADDCIAEGTVTTDKQVNDNRFDNHKIRTTSIRSMVREEVYDTIGDVNDDGYLDIDLVNKGEQTQPTNEEGTMRDQVHEYLDLNDAVQEMQGEYDYAYKGQISPENGYVDTGGVGRKLPEIPVNSPTTGIEGAKDSYSQLKHEKLPEHMYERMADEHGYLKPIELANVNSTSLTHL